MAASDMHCVATARMSRRVASRVVAADMLPSWVDVTAEIRSK
jgi:hypothetical protein